MFDFTLVLVCVYSVSSVVSFLILFVDAVSSYRPTSLKDLLVLITKSVTPIINTFLVVACFLEWADSVVIYRRKL